MFEGKLSGGRFRSTLDKRLGIVLADHLGDIWRKDLLGGMAELLIERDVKKLGRDLVDQHILAIGRPFDCQPDRKIVDDRLRNSRASRSCVSIRMRSVTS